MLNLVTYRQTSANYDELELEILDSFLSDGLLSFEKIARTY